MPGHLLFALHSGLGAMGYNARNDEIRDNVARMRRDWSAQNGALAAVRRFNAAKRQGVVLVLKVRLV
jgi:hypothetical protein